MKKIILALVLLCFLSKLLFSQPLLVADANRTDWWNEPYIPVHREILDTFQIDFIQVKGNKFVDEKGQPVLFKGVSISDPDKIEKNGHWGKAHFKAIKSWNANLVRIPVHPIAIRQRGFKNYLDLLEEAVQWCTEMEMYVIIDWHSIGNLKMGLFQADMYETSLQETLYFWKMISRHFAGNPTVAFYEIFNEPTVFNGTLGKCSWEEWQHTAEIIIDIIYAHDKKVIPLVAGFNWAYDLQNVEYAPIRRTGIAYVTHPYPGKCQPPREPHWEKNFGFLADRYPIVATELGYYFEGEHNLIDDGTYRAAIMNYFDQKGISWCAWVFDPKWVPQLIKNYDYEPTHSGHFFKQRMEK